MSFSQSQDGALIRRFDTESIRIEAWGRNALRVRVSRSPAFTGNDWALIPRSENPALVNFRAEIQIRPGEPAGARGPSSGGRGPSASVVNGKIRAEINHEGWLSFYNQRGEALLEEYWRNRNDIGRYTATLNLSARELRPIPGGDWAITARFEAREGERIYGLGQYQDGFLDKKGTVLELAHRNTQSSVPFALSSLGYGFLWNNPAVGRVSFARNLTEWRVEDSKELDYWVCAGDSPAEIEEAYALVSGTVPRMPDYGLGFTQCKLRYKTQAELLAVAREHKARGLPLDMMVADFFHWTIQGEWRFDTRDWPDVPAMVSELRAMGVELMVSIWPTVDTRSAFFGEMLERGYLISVDRGLRINMNWMGETVFFDFTNPEARQYIFSLVKKHYCDQGIRVFWLDEAEPEFGIYDFDIYRYHLGPALQVTNVYPMMYARAFYDGLCALGQRDIMNLVRTAWAGSQRYGALVWSGDIHSSFRSLREQLAAGLSMGLAGIPWWTTDIGGFIGGDPTDPHFRELLVRWFQWGAFCPVFRLHGDRVPYKGPEREFENGVRQFGSGAANEVWSFGEEAYPILVKYLKLREALKPYLREIMDQAHHRGSPVMRPLFYDFPSDPESWRQETEYMLGPDLLVAPILEEGQRQRQVYLPAGANWRLAGQAGLQAGGQTLECQAPLDSIPVFIRDGRDLPL